MVLYNVLDDLSHFRRNWSIKVDSRRYGKEVVTEFTQLVFGGRPVLNLLFSDRIIISFYFTINL